MAAQIITSFNLFSSCKSIPGRLCSSVGCSRILFSVVGSGILNRLLVFLRAYLQNEISGSIFISRLKLNPRKCLIKIPYKSEYLIKLLIIILFFFVSVLLESN